MSIPTSHDAVVHFAVCSFSVRLIVYLRLSRRIKKHTTLFVSSTLSMVGSRKSSYRNEQIRHPTLVLHPRLTIPPAASLDVAPSAVGDHGDEKQWIKPWKGRIKTCDQSPRHSKEYVTSIMDLTGEAICSRQKCHFWRAPGHLHHPLQRISLPVLVLMVSGFLMNFHGN